MKEWIKDLFTDANGDADEIVLYSFIAVVSYHAMGIVSLIMTPTHTFDLQAFAVGDAALITAVFAGRGMKSKLERNPSNDS